MKRSIRAIGVFDSGVGGLTVFREIARALPGEPLIYLGDSARVPYGTKSPSTIVRYALEGAGHLMGRDVNMLVVACQYTLSHLPTHTLRLTTSSPGGTPLKASPRSSGPPGGP